MADEHVLVYETHEAIPFTCENTLGIEKGTAVRLLDPATVSAATTLADICGGVTKTEKIASDGKTKVSVYRGGIFRAKISGSVTAGDPLVFAGGGANNLLATAAVNAEAVWGIAFETGTNAETILYELSPTTMQLA